MRALPPAVSPVVVSILTLFLLAGCANVHVASSSLSTPNPPSSPPPTAVANGTVTITPQYAAVAPGQTFQFSATSSNGGAIQWSVSGGGSIDATGKYTAPATISNSENVTVTAALASAASQDYATAVVSIIQPGKITCPPLTGNPQVAQYSVFLPAPGNVSVQFGPGTDYGLNTWQVGTPSSHGGQVHVWVAGMRGQTLYHMRGQVVLSNGATFADADQTCTTGAPPVTSPLQVTSMGTPQPGVEMWNTVTNGIQYLPTSDAQVFATDLQGNVIWTYTYPHAASDIVQGVQLLPNGDLLMVISFLSSLPNPGGNNLVNEVREVDLAGDTKRSVTVDDLNKKLAASNLRDASGQIYLFKSFHHDVLALPNGHWVILADYAKGYSNLPGQTGNVAVTGDAIVDVDEKGNPDWVWNTFDHLDVNRHPMNFPDWTHSNNMLYSADDHNLLLSIRHQNWIIKINFLDGTGSGDILWKLGYEGDFTLMKDGSPDTDPADWFYAQHGMNYATLNTTGVFRLVLMDNGNDRVFSTGQVTCNPNQKTSSSCYSTMPVLEINESARTATLIKRDAPGSSEFSFFGGNAEQLANGNYEVDFASTPGGALVQELDAQSLNPVWQASSPGFDQYHVNRWQSLYPGVQW